MMSHKRRNGARRNFDARWVASLFCFAILFFIPAAEARVFSYADSWLAAYLRGSVGMSSLNDKAYADTVGTDIAFKDGVDYNFGGEIGLAVLLSETLTLRLGVEGLGALTARDEGQDPNVVAGNVESVSHVSVFNPMATAEYVYHSIGGLRLFTMAGIGYATVKVSNEYTLASGMPALYSYSGNNPYKESWESSPIISWQIGTGLEYSFMSNVTINLDVGWRFLEATKFTHKSAQEVIRGNAATTVKAGGTVRDNADRAVQLDLGGVFAGVMFKFYIPNFN